jgi:hypothetical protein
MKYIKIHLENTVGNYSTETVIKIYDDTSGGYIQVGPDTDGLDLVDITCVESYAKSQKDWISLPWMDKEQAVLLAKAILKLYGSVE